LWQGFWTAQRAGAAVTDPGAVWSILTSGEALIVQRLVFVVAVVHTLDLKRLSSV